MSKETARLSIISHGLHPLACEAELPSTRVGAAPGHKRRGVHRHAILNDLNAGREAGTGIIVECG